MRNSLLLPRRRTRPAPRGAAVLVSWPRSMCLDAFCLVFVLKCPAVFGTALKNVMAGLSLPSTLASLLWVCLCPNSIRSCGVEGVM